MALDNRQWTPLSIALSQRMPLMVRTLLKPHASASKCDGCEEHLLPEGHLRCTMCADYDLCRLCVDEAVHTKTHLMTHPLHDMREEDEAKLEQLLQTVRLNASAFE